MKYFLVKIEPPCQQLFSYSPNLNLSTALGRSDSSCSGGGEMFCDRPSAIGQDSALVELTAVAAAVWFTALSPQGVERAWEQRFSCEACFEQLRELLLGFQKFGAERADLLADELVLGPSVDHYYYIPTDSEECLSAAGKKPKKVIPSEKGEGREATAL